MTKLLYKTPPPHRTHHDPTFALSSAMFTFDAAFVAAVYRKRVASHDKFAAKYIVGAGHKRERELLVDALKELELHVDTEVFACPASVARTFANVMQSSVYNRFITVHCERCNEDFGPRHLAKIKWVVDNADGTGSSGSRLMCPNGHVLYASIESVTD